MEMKHTDVGVLDKVMWVLSTFTAGRTVQTPQEVAAAADMPLPTIYRLLQAMAEHGLLEAEGRSFRLGARLIYLGGQALKSLDIRRAALPAMRELCSLSGENVHLNVRRDIFRVLVEVLPGARHVRAHTPLGEPLPLGIGGSGLVLLAWLDAGEARALAERSMAQLGYSRDFSDLEDRLAAVRRDGYAISDGDRHPDVAAVAMPIWDAVGNVAASMSLVAPRMAVPVGDIARFIPDLTRATAKASQNLGSY